MPNTDPTPGATPTDPTSLGAGGPAGAPAAPATPPPPAAQTPPPGPAPTPAPASTDYTNPIAAYYKTVPLTAPTPTDEATIQENYRSQMQSQIDAVNGYYNTLVNQQNQQAADRSGQTRAIDARSGTLGTDFSVADTAKTDLYNKQIADATEAERENKIGTINDQINQMAQAEITARKQEALGNANAYMTYLQTTQQQARDMLKDVGTYNMNLTPEQKSQLQSSTGLDPMTFDAVLNSYRSAGMKITYNYTNLGNGSVLRTGTMANGQAVPEQKFQYDLGPNDEFSVAADGTPLIITKQGNQITGVKIAPGFDQSQFAPSKQAPFATYPGQQVLVYNPATKQWEQQSSGSSGSSAPGSAVYQSGTAPRISDNNNPTAMTTDVAKAGGLVEGQDYVQGTPFTDSQGNTLYTAKLIGDPIATTIKAIDQGGLYTPMGQPRWSYINEIPNANNWKSLDYTQKVAVVNQIYQREGGKGLVGTGASNNGPTQPYDATSPVDNLARTWLQTGSSNRSRQDPPEGAIEARGRQLAAQFGLPSDFDPATATASVKADVGALVDLTDQQANTQKSLATVDANGQLLLKGMQLAGINQNAPFINEMQNAANRKLIGSGDLVAYQNSLNTLQAEYAKLLQGNGQTTDKAKGNAEAALPGNITAAALQTVIQRIHDEGTNVLNSLNDTISKKKADIGGVGGSSASGSFSVTTPDGMTHTFPTQDLLNQFKTAAGL